MTFGDRWSSMVQHLLGDSSGGASAPRPRPRAPAAPLPPLVVLGYAWVDDRWLPAPPATPDGPDGPSCGPREGGAWPLTR